MGGMRQGARGERRDRVVKATAPLTILHLKKRQQNRGLCLSRCWSVMSVCDAVHCEGAERAPRATPCTRGPGPTAAGRAPAPRIGIPEWLDSVLNTEGG